MITIQFEPNEILYEKKTSKNIYIPNKFPNKFLYLQYIYNAYCSYVCALKLYVWCLKC